jgi:hypothetical protein
VNRLIPVADICDALDPPLSPEELRLAKADPDIPNWLQPQIRLPPASCFRAAHSTCTASKSLCLSYYGKRPDPRFAIYPWRLEAHLAQNRPSDERFCNFNWEQCV